MYDVKKVFCPNCGLRFSKEDYPAHLDEHYIDNSNRKKGVTRKNEGKYLSEDQWIFSNFAARDGLNLAKEVKKQGTFVVTYTGEDVSVIINA